MKRKTVMLVLGLVSWVAGTNAQSVSLSEFAGDREALFHKLEISDSKAHKLERSFDMLDKQLLQLNEELNGKSRSQVKGLIDKKYKKAESEMSSFLSPAEYKQVQALNSKQRMAMTSQLTGKNGVFGKDGKNETAIVMGTCIVVGTAKR